MSRGTAKTLAFVRERLAPPPGRVLEVGAGDGRLAQQIDKLGYAVTALDDDAKSVEKARALGVTAVQAEWPAWDGAPFDAVLFTRSLHHIQDLDGAIARAASVLEPGGQIAVEDFAFAEADAATARWLADTTRRLRDAGRLPEPLGEFPRRLLAADDPLAAWHDDHHDLHALADMRSALQRHAKIEHEERCAYLFRYLEGDDETLGREIEDAEDRAIAAGEIVAIGARLVARP